MPTVPVLAPEVDVREVGLEFLVHDPATAKLHVVNATAGWILRACDGRRSTDDIARQLAEEAGEDPEKVRADVTRIVSEFERIGVLSLVA